MLGAADEVGRRGDGDRPHLQGVAAEGDALARDRQPRLRAAPRGDATTSSTGRAARARTPTASGTSATRSGAAWTVERGRASSRRSTRGSCGTSTRSSRRSASSPASRWTRSIRSALRAAKRMGFSDARLAALLGATEERRCARGARAAGIRPVYKTVDTCGAEFEAFTPYLYSTYEPARTRRGRTDAAEDHHPRRRPEPHRAGHRVRLLLRARGASRCARTGSRPSWSTATRRPSAPTTTPPTSSTSSRSRSRTCSRIVEREKPDGVIVQFGGQTPLQARGAARARRRADPRHVARRDRPRRGPRALRGRCSTTLDLQRPPNGIARTRRRGERGRATASATRCWCGRPTCSAAAPWRSSTTATSLGALHASARCARRPSSRC